MQQRLLLICAAMVVGPAGLAACAKGSSVDIGGAGVGGSTGSTMSGTGGTATASSSSASSSSTSGAASSSSASGAGGGGDGGPPVGSPVGSTCTADSDCESQLCKPVVAGTNGSVCVTPCTQQSDCPMTGYFCEPISAGSPNGYCIPQSPAHCLSCTADSDCGSLSEVCFLAPGDNIDSCNVDCSLAGSAACPSDYTCTAETVGGQSRRLCRPNTPTCLDALGGFCDRLDTPQSCTRTNSAGNCIGERTCLPSQRFSACSAAAPQCLTDCSMQSPAGCTESFCPTAVDTPVNCGTCGTACMGYMKTADNVTCTSGTCTFSCQGENYDVDGNETNGCEVLASPQGNHTESTAADAGTAPECDNGAIQISISGHLPSDTRAHATPQVAGFNTTTGSAPDWFAVTPTYGLTCANDIVMQLCVTGSGSPGCYKLTVITNEVTLSCQTSATTTSTTTAGCCPPDPSPSGSCGGATTGSGICQNNGLQFSDGSPEPPVYIEVSKTCGTTVHENPSYTVGGHF